jgi:hypothetical protein
LKSSRVKINKINMKQPSKPTNKLTKQEEKIRYWLAVHEAREARDQPLPRSSYRIWITSEEWRILGLYWIDSVGGYCQFLPWVKVGRGKPYNVHHIDSLAYSRLGCERLYYSGKIGTRRGIKEERKGDVVVLSTWVHKYIFHRLLAGGHWDRKKRVLGFLPVWVWHKTPTLQNRYNNPFPNRYQKLANEWCNLPRQIKLFICQSALVVTLSLIGLAFGYIFAQAIK